VKLDSRVVRQVVAAALDEDLGTRGDLTTDAVYDRPVQGTAHIVARENLVLAGIDVALRVFRTLDPALEFAVHQTDGARVSGGSRVVRLSGDARPILRGERTALNFLMRMSGIASAASRAVEEVAGTGCRILDTRKTAPGLRHLDKYAVACGGALNHRLGLFDAVMIKDTHLGCGLSVGDAVRRALDNGHPPEIITVEVRDLEQLDQALAAGAGRALLDNMSLPLLRSAVEKAKGKIVLEASGGLCPGALRPVAETGVDFLSLGWLTHSAPAANLAMELEPLE
jgi:nicotinate-nucleotide pyrophosphorylase (carboxylating)